MEKVINLDQEGTESEIEVLREDITLGGGAVNSVNGMTGDVVLTTSDIENTSDYQTGDEVDNAINAALATEASAREAADANLQEQIDDIPTYTDFIGTDGTTAGTSGLVPAPATTDADKFLKADGTWDNAGGGSSVNVVQSMGASTTDVMSQDATTKMIYPNYSQSPTIIGIGQNSSATHNYNIALGDSVYSEGYQSICIGPFSGVVQPVSDAIAIGNAARADNAHSVALGSYAHTSRDGEVNVGSRTNNGYNNTGYRVIGNVYDPQLDHDAANKEYVDNSVTAFVNLSVVSMTSTTITVTPDKTIAEVNDLVNAGRHVVLKLVVEQDVGSFLAGTYFFNLAFVNPNGIIANAVKYSSGTSFEYQQISPATDGTIYIRSL